MKAVTILAISLSLLAACSKPGPQDQSSVKEQPSPKKFFYFVRKMEGKTLSVQPDIGEFADAQRVEGELIGYVVQTSSGPREKTKEGKYIYTYFVAEGKDVEVIDNTGVYPSAGATVALLAANLDKADVTDLEILQVGVEPKGNSGILSLPGGGSMTRFTVQTKKAAGNTLHVLGRYKSEGGKGQIVSALEVKTDSGVTQIPLDQLIPFRKRPTPSPSPSK